MTMQITEIFSLIVDLAEALGVSKINELPGAWVCPINDKWIIALNGTSATHEVEIPGTMGATLEPMETAVFFNGWLAGLIMPSGGTICAGDAGNEDNLIAALKARINSEK